MRYRRGRRRSFRRGFRSSRRRRSLRLRAGFRM